MVYDTIKQKSTQEMPLQPNADINNGHSLILKHWAEMPALQQ
jgi:hypothetical protein